MIRLLKNTFLSALYLYIMIFGMTLHVIFSILILFLATNDVKTDDWYAGNPWWFSAFMLFPFTIIAMTNLMDMVDKLRDDRE